MDNKTRLAIYISLGLAALASIPWNPFKEKWLPILLISIFTVFTLVWMISFLFNKFSFKIILDKNKAFLQVQKIYNYAKLNGGELFATHIYPIERLPDDKLTDSFGQVKKHLFFHRLIYTDDPVILDQNIRSTFNVKSNLVDVEVLVPSSSSFLPKFIWYIIPRINIVSYYNPAKHIAMSSIGVFRIYTEKNIKTASIPVSPTIHFFSKNTLLFKKVKDYFRAFNHGHFSHFYSIEEYEKTKSNILLQSKFKSFLSHLLYLCDDTNLGILHVSLFGQHASYRKGVLDIGNLKVDFDIDLIIVCEKGKKEKVQNEIVSEVDNLDFPIRLIWGPINDDFYSVRSPDTVHIDIELFEYNDSYYKKHSLLGFSIIPSCLSIFMQNESEHCLFKVLKLPESVNGISERADVFLKKRKGLLDFKHSIITYHGRYDPIRVMSHVIRNATWVLTGHFEPSYDKTYKILENSNLKICDKNLISDIRTLMKDKTTKSIEMQYQLTSKVIDDTIENIQRLLETKNATRANNA